MKKKTHLLADNTVEYSDHVTMQMIFCCDKQIDSKATTELDFIASNALN